MPRKCLKLEDSVNHKYSLADMSDMQLQDSLRLILSMILFVLSKNSSTFANYPHGIVL